ncbi:MAG: RNA methyltransferase [Oscillospiraceae bacterium]|nr:RNA methyltransferase [Oscillospiraceae bacterium]
MVITSRKNDAVRRFRELSRDKKLRTAQGVFVIEGDHLCGEAAAAGLEIRTAFITEKAREKYPDTAQALESAAAECIVISEEIAEYISDTKAPQGLFAEVSRRDMSDASGKRIVILDGVQDPGNVGTIIRTAEALGIDCALLSADCADVYSPKTLRASMGSVFRFPCMTCDIKEKIDMLKGQGYVVYGSMLDETAQRLGKIAFPEKAAVVIGSEGSGISDEVKHACSGGLYIPISGAESLNAAAAASMILWELSK